MLRVAALRLVLIWLLALCLPAQAALAQWRACCWQLAGQAQEQEMQTHHPAGEHHKHLVSEDADAAPDTSGAHSHPSACASCCTGAFWPAAMTWHAPQTSARPLPAPPGLRLPSPDLPGLERPPRPLA